MRPGTIALAVSSLLVGLVLGLLLTNWVTLRLARRLYADANAVRLDPWGLRDRVFAPLPPQPDTRTLVALGDSTLALWPLPSAPGYRLANRGINGQTSAQVLGRFESHVHALNPQVVLLAFGINDLKTIPLFPGQREAIVAACKRNWAQAIRASRALGARVIVTTILPTGPVRLLWRPIWSADIDRAIREVNAFIVEQAKQEGALVLDSHALLANAQGTLRRELAEDELHTNQAGYALLSQALVQLLEQP